MIKKSVPSWIYPHFTINICSDIKFFYYFFKFIFIIIVYFIIILYFSFFYFIYLFLLLYFIYTYFAWWPVAGRLNVVDWFKLFLASALNSGQPIADNLNCLKNKQKKTKLHLQFTNWQCLKYKQTWHQVIHVG